MASLPVYDLDGTLSKLNSTFDFIFAYYTERGLHLRAFLGRIGMALARYTPLIRFSTRRQLLLKLLFKDLRKDDLEWFAESTYKGMFLTNLTGLGKEVLLGTRRPGILLTGCTEIPAIQIGNWLKMKKTIATSFAYRKGIISAIGQDTFGNRKIRFLDDSDLKATYYTDDLRSEARLIKLFSEVIEVDPRG